VDRQIPDGAMDPLERLSADLFPLPFAQRFIGNASDDFELD
jgi:hypothetical protein